MVDHFVDVWAENGKLLALIEVVPKVTHLLIENIAVRPDQQGKGYGYKLLHHAEELSRSLRFAEIRLYTNAAFASNLAFYSRSGYREFLRDTMVLGILTVHMMKQLLATR